MFESQFSRRSPLVSRRFTIAGPPSTFHASATSFPFPICIFIFISNERREPRSSSSSMIVHSPRNALPLADFDKNSSSMTPFPDTLFCSAFKYREKVVRERSKLMFREENKPNERSIKTPLFFFSPPLFIPITIIYTYIYIYGWLEWKIRKLENWDVQVRWKSLMIAKESDHPLAAVSTRIIHGSGVEYIPVPVYPGRSVHSAPIDNRWNKKLEFVYSLVTQIRAAILSSPPPVSFLPTLLLQHQHQRPFSSIVNQHPVYACHRHGHQHQRDNANVNPPLPSPFASRYFIFPHFSLRRFVPSDEFAPIPPPNAFVKR